MLLILSPRDSDNKIDDLVTSNFLQILSQSIELSKILIGDDQELMRFLVWALKISDEIYILDFLLLIFWWFNLTIMKSSVVNLWFNKS